MILEDGYCRRIAPPLPLPPSVLRLSNLHPPILTTTDRGVAGCGDPIWGAVCSHTQHAVVDRRMINLFSLGYTLPQGVEPVEPDLVCVLQSVVMNVKFPDSRYDVLRGAREILGGSGGIPGRICRRSTRELTLLLDRDKRSGFYSCGWQCRCCRC